MTVKSKQTPDVNSDCENVAKATSQQPIPVSCLFIHGHGYHQVITSHHQSSPPRSSSPLPRSLIVAQCQPHLLESKQLTVKPSHPVPKPSRVHHTPARITITNSTFPNPQTGIVHVSNTCTTMYLLQFKLQQLN